MAFHSAPNFDHKGELYGMVFLASIVIIIFLSVYLSTRATT